MESQTRVSKRVPREFRNWRVQGNPPTLRQPFANPLPTFSANPSPTPIFPWTPGTGLETRVSGLLDSFQDLGRVRFAQKPDRKK